MRTEELDPELGQIRLMELGGVVPKPLLVSISGGEPVVRARREMVDCRRACHFITNFGYQRHQL